MASSTYPLLPTLSVVLIPRANTTMPAIFMWDLGIQLESSHFQRKHLQTEQSPSPIFLPLQGPRPIYLPGPYSRLLYHNQMIIFSLHKVTVLDGIVSPILPHRIQFTVKPAGFPVIPCVHNYISFRMFPVVMSCLKGMSLLYDPIKPIMFSFFTS